ncbi:hypothetical protein MSAN_02001000 [Mycena sanguinolenta]|uniref:Uncharacterized protein n=1 Tax=Mycena sanguinolenta TaxID=230812 RepID=A0A8H7CM59_9AGAR|nr:hypothetical protein MSAN_02001000 [Mycena sanguinolenta]
MALGFPVFFFWSPCARPVVEFRICKVWVGPINNDIHILSSSPHMRTHTKRPLPELHPETAAAVLISQQRARDCLIEARLERDKQRAQAVRALIADLEQNGLPDYFTVRAADFDEETSRRDAEYALSRFAQPRLAKMHRARVRQYRRRKYAHELIHPPFSPPDFPHDPALDAWHDTATWGSTESWGSTSGWGVMDTSASLTIADDEISPVLTPKSLPAVYN